MNAVRQVSVSQNLEGVIPLAAEEAWKAPKHAERLQGAGGNDSATVGFLRVARAEHDLMAMFQEATRQYLSNNSGT
jgi:fructose-1-phosphate kinase PfkB-like protein